MKVNFLILFGAISVAILTGVHDMPALKFSFNGDFLFNDYLYMVGIDLFAISWGWAVKTLQFDNKVIRYTSAYVIDMFVIDLGWISFYDPYTIKLSKIGWQTSSLQLFILLLFLNWRFHWFRRQRFI